MPWPTNPDDLWAQVNPTETLNFIHSPLRQLKFNSYLQSYVRVSQEIYCVKLCFINNGLKSFITIFTWFISLLHLGSPIKEYYSLNNINLTFLKDTVHIVRLHLQVLMRPWEKEGIVSTNSSFPPLSQCT